MIYCVVILLVNSITMFCKKIISFLTHLEELLKHLHIMLLSFLRKLKEILNVSDFAIQLNTKDCTCSKHS